MTCWGRPRRRRGNSRRSCRLRDEITARFALALVRFRRAAEALIGLRVCHRRLVASLEAAWGRVARLVVRVKNVVMAFENVGLPVESVGMADAIVGVRRGNVAVSHAVVGVSNATIVASRRLVAVSRANVGASQGKLVAGDGRPGVYRATAEVVGARVAARQRLTGVPDDLTAVDFPFVALRRASVAARRPILAVAHAKTGADRVIVVIDARTRWCR